MAIDLTPPFAVSASYQNSQMADGVYNQGGSQVFSHLVNPPVSGVAAELASDDAAAAAGYVPGSAVNEVQTVTVLGTPTGGTFPLSFRGKTATIAYNAAATAIDSALEALPTVGVGNVNVGGGPLPGAAVTVTFVGALAGQNVPRLSAAVTGLTGGTNMAVQVAQTTPGHRAGTVTATNNPARQNSYQQRDAMRDFYDSASGNHI